MSKAHQDSFEEVLAGRLYTEYCVNVGGNAFNGDSLPNWADFRANPNKKLQSNAWIAVARLADGIFRL